MTLRERFEKLEPRERRLLTVFFGVVAAFLFLLGPVALASYVSDRRGENTELRHLIDSIYEARSTLSERRAKHDAIVARYAKPAPQLAGFIEEVARANTIGAAESQDRPELPHGKRFMERMTVVRMHKVSMLPLALTLEKIEQSGHPVAVTRLDIKPRVGEPDSYEVELGVSAYDRKADAPSTAGTSAAPSPAAGNPAERDP